MKRRDFLTKASVGTAAVALTACGDKETKSKKQQQTLPSSQVKVKWRMASSFGKTTEVYENSILFAESLRKATNGLFDIQVHAAGELMPAMEVLNGTQQGTVECCHTASTYFANKNSVFSIGTALPFGMNNRELNAWVYHGGGQQLLDEFYATHNVRFFLAGNTGTQMGGWFRKEVKTLADMKGLKMRISGIAVDILAQIGVIAQQLPSSDIFPALERGDLDAAEWVGPLEDEKQGFYKVAKYYYAPGWWEPGTCWNFFVNNDHWAKLPKEYQETFRAVAVETNCLSMSAYDQKNPAALARLVQNGVIVQNFSNEIMEAAYIASRKVYADESAKNPAFKKIFDAYEKYRLSMNSWFSVAETRMDKFLQAHK